LDAIKRIEKKQEDIEKKIQVLEQILVQIYDLLKKR